MPLTTMNEDLLREFEEECNMVNTQMKMLDPLGTSLRRPAAQRLLSDTTLIITEYICYALFIGILVFAAMAHTIKPFSVMDTIYHNPEINTIVGSPNLNNYLLASYGIVVIAAILVLAIGRMARVIRLKNDILHQAGKDIKTILEQHLQRKAALDIINQRHGLGLSGISIPVKAPKIGVAQLGFDEEEEEDN
jgi:hypothetical protein